MLTRNELATTLDFEVRLATLDDLDQLIGLHEKLYVDSALPRHGVDFDPERLRLWLARCLSTGRMPHLVVADEDKLVGWASYGIDHTFTVQPYAYLNKFYVLPSWRGSLVPRALLKLVLDCAYGDGAKCFQALIGSGSDAMPSATNLFRKFGFHDMGGTMLAKEL